MKGRILIVEDERAIKDNIEYALKSEGFETHWCARGQDARNEITRGHYDLVLLDVGLPDINGFDLCKEIRSSSSVPVIMLTARSEEVDRVLGLELGADDYIVKPFSPRELTARIRAVLRRSNNNNHDNDSAAAAPADTPIHIDSNKNQATYFGEPLKLSRYEHRILEMLAEKPGWVFSRDQIMQAAWEEDDAIERTVDTHIKTLRAKLREVKPDIEAIITHRGLGYSLREDWRGN